MKSTTKANKRKNVEKINKTKNGKETKAPEKIEKPEKKTEEELKYGPMPHGKFPHLRVWARATIAFCVLVFVWYTSNDKKEIVLASQKDVLQNRGQKFECSQSFIEEIKKYPECVPPKCGRFMSDKLVTNSEAENLLKLAKNGISLGNAEGGAAILDLHSGALSDGKRFINVYSLESAKKMFTAPEMTAYKIVKTKIQHAIAQNFGIHVDSLYLTHPTFFSKLTNLDPKTVHDEYWHPHVDKDTYESFHYTSLLYLTDYGQDFTGGRFVFVGENKQNVTLEPRKGRVLMFTSGEENVHFVERVQSGTRYAITVSFTCDSTKAVPDPTVNKKFN